LDTEPDGSSWQAGSANRPYNSMSDKADTGRPWQENRHSRERLLDGVRRIAMSLPDVAERFSRGAPYFYVRRRALCYFHDAEFGSDGRTTLWCPSPPGVADEVVAAEPTRFFHPTPSASGVFSTWLGMYLDSTDDELDWTEIAAVIEDAYRLVAPRHLVAQLDRN